MCSRVTHHLTSSVYVNRHPIYHSDEKVNRLPKKPFLVGSMPSIKGVDTNEMPKMVLVLPWYTNLVYHFWYGISPKTPNIRPILAGIWYGTGILVTSSIWYFSYEDEVVFAD